MKRIKFNKPGRYIARNMVDLFEVEDVDREYEVPDDFVEFNVGLVTCVDEEPTPQPQMTQEEIDALVKSVEESDAAAGEGEGEGEGAEGEGAEGESKVVDLLKGRRRSRARKDDGTELLG